MFAISRCIRQRVITNDLNLEIMSQKTKFYLIIAAIAIAVILIGCGIAVSIKFGTAVLAVVSFLIGSAVGGYVYSIYKKLKDVKK